MKRNLMVTMIKGTLILSALLLLSVTTPSATPEAKLPDNLDDIRTKNQHTLKTIEYEFNKVSKHYQYR